MEFVYSIEYQQESGEICYSDVIITVSNPIHIGESLMINNKRKARNFLVTCGNMYKTRGRVYSSFLSHDSHAF